MYGARWVSVPFTATATNLFANLCGHSDTIKNSESIDGRNKREIKFLIYSHPRSPPLQCWVCVARSTNPQHCNVGSGGGRGTQNKNVSVSVAMAHWLPDITHVIDGGV